jgi:hypothetical protein
MTLKEYDYVELIESLDPSLPVGTRGAIVMTYEGPDPACSEYEVEFVDKDGETIAIRTVKGSQLRKVSGEGGR